MFEENEKRANYKRQTEMKTTSKQRKHHNGLAQVNIIAIAFSYCCVGVK